MSHLFVPPVTGCAPNWSDKDPRVLIENTLKKYFPACTAEQDSLLRPRKPLKGYCNSCMGT
jgi:hypothetical protein